MTREQADAAVESWSARLGDEALGVVSTSAATGAGLEDLRAAIVRGVPPEEEPVVHLEVEAAHRTYRPGAGEAFEVSRSGPGTFRVAGPGVERLIARHDIDNDEALRYIEGRLRGMGVIRALVAAGFEPGDDVAIAGTVFELDPAAPLG